MCGGLLSFLAVTATAASDWGSEGPLPNVLFALAYFAFPAVGAMIVVRQPRNHIGWLLLGIGSVWGVITVMDNYVGYSFTPHASSLPAADVVLAIDSGLWVPGIGLMGTYLLLLFPDGHLPSPRWRWLGWGTAIVMFLTTVAIDFYPGDFSDSGYPNVQNPLGLDALAPVLEPLRAMLLLLPVAIILSAAALIMRFRRSKGLERVQLKWLTTSAAGVAVVYLVAMVASFGQSQSLLWVQLVQDLALFSFVLIPVSIGVAILRYRLYEIDRIINRTIVYTGITLILAGLYVGVTLLSQVVLAPIAGTSQIGVAVSTLLVAALFRPVRTRVQNFVDRRFYREKFDAQQTLEAFAAQLRDVVDLDELRTGVVEVVRGHLQPTRIGLWIRQDDLSDRRDEPEPLIRST